MVVRVQSEGRGEEEGGEGGGEVVEEEGKGWRL
jgi:hypothetical protein